MSSKTSEPKDCHFIPCYQYYHQKEKQGGFAIFSLHLASQLWINYLFTWLDRVTRIIKKIFSEPAQKAVTVKSEAFLANRGGFLNTAGHSLEP